MTKKRLIHEEEMEEQRQFKRPQLHGTRGKLSACSSWLDLHDMKSLRLSFSTDEAPSDDCQSTTGESERVSVGFNDTVALGIAVGRVFRGHIWKFACRPCLVLSHSYFTVDSKQISDISRLLAIREIETVT